MLVGMAAMFRIDQVTPGMGTPDVTRHDLVPGEVITLTATSPAPGPGVSYAWELLDAVGSTAALNGLTGPTVTIGPFGNITPPCGFRIQLTANDGVTISRSIRIASVRSTSAGMRVLLFSESAPPSAKLGSNTPALSEDNAFYADLAGRGALAQNWRDWAEWAWEVTTKIEQLASAGSAYVPVGRKVSAGSGLTGGGSLTVDRTLAVDTSTIATRSYADTTADDSARDPTNLTVAAAGLQGAVDFNGQEITHIADPTAADSAATRSYVDGHSGSIPIWSWNRTDISQFDPTPLHSTGMAPTMSFAAASATKPFATLNISTVITGGGGGAAFRVTGLVLPSLFKIRIRYLAIEAGVRVGPFFFDSSTWAGTLVGTGYTAGNANFARFLQAYAAAAFPPFNLPFGTPAFAGVANSDTGGSVHEIEMVTTPGSMGVAPLISGLFVARGGAANQSVLTGVQADWLETTSKFNGNTLDGFGLVVQSESTGTFVTKIVAIDIFDSDFA